MNVPSRFVRQHGRLSWKARMTRPCDVPCWQDRVPEKSSRLEIKLRSGERAMVGGCVLDTLVGMAEQQLCWLCVLDQRMCGSLTRHQLLKVSQEQLRMASVTERVADDVIHQELRAIGENIAADGQVLPKLDFSSDPPPPSADESTQTSPQERADAIASKIAARDLVHRQVLFNPEILKDSVSPEDIWYQEEECLRRRRVPGPIGKSQGRELLKMKPHHLPRQNELNPLI